MEQRFGGHGQIQEQGNKWKQHPGLEKGSPPEASVQEMKLFAEMEQGEGSLRSGSCLPPSVVSVNQELRYPPTLRTAEGGWGFGEGGWHGQ